MARHPSPSGGIETSVGLSKLIHTEGSGHLGRDSRDLEHLVLNPQMIADLRR